MNHWITSERLAADRHADFAREAIGDARLRASRQEEWDPRTELVSNGADLVNRGHGPTLWEKAQAFVRARVTRSGTA